MSQFAHLHNHSDYSLLDGAVKVGDMVNLAQEMGMKHLGLTDHGNLFGAIHFENACRSAGINPVIGCEVYVAPGSRTIKPTTGPKNHHLVLYCRNLEGYQNLMYIVSLGFIEGFYYKPRIDDDLLRDHHEGLMASSACLAGEIPRLIMAGQMDAAREKALYYSELFGPDNFYLEIMDHGIPEEKIVKEGIIQLGKETGLPVIATNDVHYLKKDHANAQDILICIDTGKKKADENRLKMDNPEFYLKSPEEMRELFADVPEALENTVKLASRCDLTLPKPGPILPDYKIPQEFQHRDEYLKHLTWEGIKGRYSEITDEIKKRVDYELDILISMDFAGYFLIVYDFVNWAKNNDIPVGPGRGSGAGSIVAYALGITDVEPLQYGLLFERFLNPERVSMPDFDIDFCNEGRNDVINYVTEKYGKEQVAGICTFGTLKTKAVLKDVARVLDISFDEANLITKLIPEGKAPDGRKINTAVALEIEPQLMDFYKRGGVYKELFDTAKILEGMNRHISTHACGMVIGKSQLTDFVPLFKDQKTSSITTQFTMDIIEPCGLVKMDFLGLKTLTILKNTAKLIQKVNPDFNLEDIPEDDETTFKMLGEGRSEAVFQFESAGMQKILRQARPTNIEDLIALNALYRPGPMQFIPQFVEGKHDPSTIKYPDPTLQELLEPTYGVIVYQEQVMKVAQIIGGFSLGKADILRRAMGKKKVKDMEKMKVEFLEGAAERGHSKEHATYIFEMLEPFAGYGFNKSHAAAYSIVAYKTAYCKANYPAEFMAANLTNEINNHDKLKEYIDTTKKMGLEIMPPDINYSEKYFTVVDGKIFYGLMGIKGMGAAAAEKIIEGRETRGEFTSFVDFLEKVDLRAVNKKVLEVSIKCGLFDRIESLSRATLLANMENVVNIVQKNKDAFESAQASLFGGCEDEVKPEITFESAEDWPEEEVLKTEKELLGFYFSGHPLDKYRTYYKKSITLKLQNLTESTPPGQYTIMGMLKSLRTHYDRKGNRIAFAVVEDYYGEQEVAFFSKTYNQYGHLLENDAVLGFQGKLRLRGDRLSFSVDEVKQPEELKERGVRELHIQLNDDSYNIDKLENLLAFIQDHTGDNPVYIHIPENDEEFVVKANAVIQFDGHESNIKALNDRPMVSRVWQI